MAFFDKLKKLFAGQEAGDDMIQLNDPVPPDTSSDNTGDEPAEAGGSDDVGDSGSDSGSSD